MTSPLKLIKFQGADLGFLFLFSNADAFYISARRALLYSWVSVGCSNAHQAIELYIKAILKLNHEAPRGHYLVTLLKKYKSRDPYFSTILGDTHKVDFLTELSNAYLSHRYGEVGSDSKTVEILALLDELSFHLRNIYLRNIKSASQQIYMPDKLKEEFLSNNAYFTADQLTNNAIFSMFPPLG